MKLSLKKWCLDCVMAGHDDDDYYAFVVPVSLQS